MRASSDFGLALLAALVALAACGGSSADTDVASPDTTGDSTPTSSATPISSATPATAALDTTSTPTSTDAEAAVTTTAPSELADLEAIITITVTTPASGNGQHPLLSWNPVDGAADYSLTLTPSDGSAYWAWRGAGPQIWLGGSAEEPPADVSGPSLAEPMILRILAFDADGDIVAASQPVEIAP